MKLISLNPRDVPAGVALLQAQPSLGLEITIPVLAEACSLGNIDPQHTGGDATTAAIQAALTHPVPPDGAALAILRPDADALGAAAVLRIRRRGQTLSDADRYRVRQIAEADTEASGPWPGPRPVAIGGLALLRATSVVEAMCMDHRLPLGDRVAAMERWILDGTLHGDLDLQARLLEEANTALTDLDVQVRNGVVAVRGAHRLAMSIGYRHAPVVVATNPAFTWQGGEPHTKHTIARWNSSHPMRWDDMLAELRAQEPGWGGSSSICGSPQGTGSTLTQDQVLDIVARHLS